MIISQIQIFDLNPKQHLENLYNERIMNLRILDDNVEMGIKNGKPKTNANNFSEELLEYRNNRSPAEAVVSAWAGNVSYLSVLRQRRTLDSIR